MYFKKKNLLCIFETSHHGSGKDPRVQRTDTGRKLTDSDCHAAAGSAHCYQGPAGRSYGTLLKGLRVLPLPTVLTITPFQLVRQLPCHPAVIYLPHWSSPVTLNFSELDSHADVLGSCCCWPCPVWDGKYDLWAKLMKPV